MGEKNPKKAVKDTRKKTYEHSHERQAKPALLADHVHVSLQAESDIYVKAASLTMARITAMAEVNKELASAIISVGKQELYDWLLEELKTAVKVPTDLQAIQNSSTKYNEVIDYARNLTLTILLELSKDGADKDIDAYSVSKNLAKKVREVHLRQVKENLQKAEDEGHKQEEQHLKEINKVKEGLNAYAHEDIPRIIKDALVGCSFTESEQNIEAQKQALADYMRKELNDLYLTRGRGSKSAELTGMGLIWASSKDREKRQGLVQALSSEAMMIAERTEFNFAGQGGMLADRLSAAYLGIHTKNISSDDYKPLSPDQERSLQTAINQQREKFAEMIGGLVQNKAEQIAMYNLRNPEAPINIQDIDQALQRQSREARPESQVRSQQNLVMTKLQQLFPQEFSAILHNLASGTAMETQARKPGFAERVRNERAQKSGNDRSLS